MDFDHATAFVVVGLLYLLTPIATWGVLTGKREQTTLWWCAGGLLLGLSALWVALSLKQVPWLIYQAVANLLIFSGAFLKMNTLRVWQGKRALVLPLVFFFPLYLLGAGLVELAFGREIVRALLVSSHALLYGHLAWLAWRVYRIRQWRSVLWIFGGYCLVSTILVMLLLDFDGGRPSIWVAGVPAMILSVVGAFHSFINHLGYVGALLERSRADETAALVEATKQSERRSLLRTITISERERLLAGLARKVSHELSQPLTSIKSTVGLMSRAQTDNRLQQLNLADLIKRLDGAVKVAAGMLEQIRPLAKAHACSRSAVSIRAVLTQAIEILDLNVHPEICHLGPSTATNDNDWVEANRVELIQVLINLLVNAQQACKAAGVATRIQITIDVEAESVRCRIADNGPGFSQEALAHIPKIPYSSKDSGMGLGLWLCDEIVQRNNGRLLFSNLDRGAVVELRWPRATQDLP